MITNKINNTKANAAPEILLFPQPQFISHSSFFIFTFYYKQIHKICECLLLCFRSFFAIIFINGGYLYYMKKFIVIFCTIFLVCGCGTSKLDDGKQSVVKFDKGGISAQELYEKLKESYGAEAIVTMIDTELLSREYKRNSEENSYVKQVIDSMKSQYKDNYLDYAKQYYGVSTDEELEDYVRLSYRRNLWRTDYAESIVNDTQIDDYYKDHLVGDIEASHILISSEAKQDASDEEKKEAEAKALEKAKEVINRLNNGEKFEDLAKELSADNANKNDGGKLPKFNDRSSYDKNFLEGAIELEVGKYTTTPVKSQFGYHIIYKSSQAEKPALKDVKDSIISKIAQDNISSDTNFNAKAILALREKHGIKITDSDIEKAYNKLYGL